MKSHAHKQYIISWQSTVQQQLVPIHLLHAFITVAPAPLKTT